MRVNLGGDPGRDDYGLPPVDIEIPDDARELDRDVQAYHRELRVRRRRMLLKRLGTPLTRDGMVLPLLAGCLALTLLAGTLLTVFTARPGPIQNLPSRNTAQPRLGPSSRKPPPLPDVTVLVGGQHGREEPLRSLWTGSALLLALIPPNCRCVPDVRLLRAQARQASIGVYLVGARGVGVIGLARRVGVRPAHAVEDFKNRLRGAYHPPVLTAVLVNADGTVAHMVVNPARGPALRAALHAVSPGQPKRPPQPAGPAPSSAAVSG